MRISNSYVASFYKAKEFALNQPVDIMGIEVPSELDMTLELKVKVVKKRPDAFAILQLIRKEDYGILAKWEIGLPFPSGANAEDDGGTQ